MAAQTPTSSASTAATATQSKATPGSPRIIQSGGIKQPVKVVSSTAAGATVSSSLYCSAERLVLKCCHPISTITNIFLPFEKKLTDFNDITNMMFLAGQKSVGMVKTAIFPFVNCGTQVIKRLCQYYLFSTEHMAILKPLWNKILRN